MNCPHHPRAEVIGYCSVCGAFGCSECLNQHEGQWLCPRHYRPVAQKIEEQKRHEEVRRRHGRQLLVVRYLDGRTQYGVCFALNPKEAGFHLDLMEADGKTREERVFVVFKDLKAVFVVKSFDGKGPKEDAPQEVHDEGNELIVEFQDGEVIRGLARHAYDPREPRFYLRPKDPKSNNLGILVEVTACKGVYTLEEFKARRQAAKETPVPSEGLSQEETLGDFYFGTRNYEEALQQYTVAVQKAPQSRRIRRKYLTTKFNIGVQYIKRRDYPNALASMEEILRLDPENQHAIKKVSQLRHIVKKQAHAGTE